MASIARAAQSQEQLETLLDRVENQLRPLSFNETRDLARLYRICSARLSVVRTRGRDPEAIRHLNALCVRAYTRLQVPDARQRRGREFFFKDLPQTLAATAWLQAVVAILMIAGALAGAAIMSHSPAAGYACIPDAMYPSGQLETLTESSQARAEFLERKPVGFGIKSAFSAFLFTHNMQVGMLSFATGVLAGIPTVLLIFYNGLTLGAFAWIFSRDPMWPMFWAWLLPHAVFELLAITLCSTAGLMLGRAVIAPGRQTVTGALRSAAQPALELVGAAVPLLIGAAAIESFLRQSMISTAARFDAAAIAVGIIVTYIWYVRRLARKPVPKNLEWLR